MSERKSSQERRKEIVDTALEIIHHEGPENLTTRTLAENIGVSEAAIYKHFSNKEEIVKGAAKEIFEKDRLPKPKNLEKTLDSQKLLQSLMKNIFQDLEENPGVAAVLFQDNVFSQYPEVKEMFREHRQLKKKKLVKRLKRAQQIGLLSGNFDPQTAATIIMGSIRLTVFEWMEEDFSYNLTDGSEELAKEISKILEAK